jgi:phenylacetate-CoA ligase
MTTVLSRPEGLHAIENASCDEISGLQLERMKWSVRHAYENSTSDLA